MDSPSKLNGNSLRQKETSRLLAKPEVPATTAHMIRNDERRGDQIRSKDAHEFLGMGKTLATRQEIGREKPPQVVYTNRSQRVRESSPSVK